MHAAVHARLLATALVCFVVVLVLMSSWA